jgi:hypothetical protein
MFRLEGCMASLSPFLLHVFPAVEFWRKCRIGRHSGMCREGVRDLAVVVSRYICPKALFANAAPT